MVQKEAGCRYTDSEQKWAKLLLPKYSRRSCTLDTHQLRRGCAVCLQAQCTQEGVTWSPDCTLVKKQDCVTSLVVQWLRLHAPDAGGLGLNPGQGTGSHMLQVRVHIATSKAWCSQINNSKKQQLWQARSAALELGCCCHLLSVWGLHLLSVWGLHCCQSPPLPIVPHATLAHLTHLYCLSSTWSPLSSQPLHQRQMMTPEGKGQKR